MNKTEANLELMAEIEHDYVEHSKLNAIMNDAIKQIKQLDISTCAVRGYDIASILETLEGFVTDLHSPQTYALIYDGAMNKREFD